MDDLRLDSDLHHLDVQIRMIQDRNSGRDEPASKRDVAELAHYVRELIKLIPSVASSHAR